jgi:TolB-like protein
LGGHPIDTFFKELKRRNVYRVGAAYAVVAWVVLQLAANVAPILDLPPWVARTVLLLLVIGFPVTLVFAWVQQIAPERGAPASNSKLDMFLAGALVIIIALMSYQQLAPNAVSGTAQVEEASVAAARSASLSPSGAISIAVLPFANLSDDKQQEFFSDGMTDEISGALAKIPDLRVVGRSSAFQFKGENKDLRAIGLALGATHLIEGSVRKAGTRVRISAQLVQAGNGLQVWSENYDRELTDVFAIQEDIAKAIATSLRMPLGLKPGESLISSRIVDPEIYEQYLQGRALLRTRTFPAALITLEALIARAPEFAPGWATLSNAYRTGTNPAMRQGDSKLVALLQDRSEAAARKAIQLDPGYAGGYAQLAATQARRGKWVEADGLFKRALALDPSDAELLQSYSGILYASGYLKEALRAAERLRAVEPLVPLYNSGVARIMLANGQIDASIPILEQNAYNSPQNAYLAEAHAIEGRFSDAADTLLRITAQIDRRSVENAARLLRSAPSKTDTPEKLPALDAELGFAYAYIGAPERVLEYSEKSAQEGNFAPMTMIWRQSSAIARKSERFKMLMRKTGLTDYWRVRGWPDLCRAAGADDFVCD